MFDDIIFCEYLDILKEISDFRSDPFTLFDLDLPPNSYMIPCTNIQNFEERENRASTVLVDHTFGSDMNLFGYDMILFGSDLYYLVQILYSKSFQSRL